MLSLSLLLLLTPVPDATPDRCRAAAEHLAQVLPVVRQMLNDDAAKESRGEKPDNDAAMRANIEKNVRDDEARIATIRKRYPNVVPSDAAVDEMKDAEVSVVVDLVHTCAA